MARKPVDSLYCDSVYVTPVKFDWSSGYGDEDNGWETIIPSAGDLTVEQCKAVLDDAGVDLPDPNPWEMDSEQLFDLLKENGLADDFLAEPGDDKFHQDVGAEDEPGLCDDVTREELLDRVIEAINDEEIDGLDDYREAVNDHYQEDGADRFSPMMNYYYPLPDYRGNESDDQLLLDREGGSVALVRVHGNVVLALTGGGMDLSWDICHAFMLLGYLPPMHFVDLPRFAGKKLDEDTAYILDGCIRSCDVVEHQAARAKQRLEEYKAELAGVTA